jgi:hypothetical protein
VGAGFVALTAPLPSPPCLPGLDDDALPMDQVDQLDEWIAKLFECKPLSEAQVKNLCDKVRRFTWFDRWLQHTNPRSACRLGRSSPRSQMCNLYAALSQYVVTSTASSTTCASYSGSADERLTQIICLWAIMLIAATTRYADIVRQHVRGHLTSYS